jgi:DNA-binding IclR family transcriptional regulator
MDKQTIDKILDALKNGNQHTLLEITEKTNIQEPKAKLIVSFLQKFQFVQVDKRNGKIRLSSLTRQFLEKLDKHDPTAFYEEITA